MKKSLLKVSLIYSTVAVASCGFNIEKIHPTFLDTERGYGRVYAAKKINPASCGAPNYVFRDTKVRTPISEMNGYICLPVKEGQDILKHYDEYLYRKSKCPQVAEQTPR